MVIFTSTSLGMKELSPREESEEILTRVGISGTKLDQYETSTSPISIVGLDGRLLYLNNAYRVMSGRTDEDLMNMYVFEVATNNPHVQLTMDMIFKTERPREHTLVADFFLASRQCHVSLKCQFVILTVSSRFESIHKKESPLDM